MEIGAIKKKCKEIAISGMLSLLYICCYDEVQAIPAPTAGTHTIDADLTMRPEDVGNSIDAGTFSKWQYSQKDQTWESEQNEESRMWNTTVQIFIPATSGEKSAVLNEIGDESGIVITLDKKKRRRIIGSIDLPCSITTKSQLTPKDGYIVTIKWQSAYEPYYYTGAIVT